MEGRFSLGGSFRHKSKVPRSRNSRPLSCDLSDFTSSYFRDQSDVLQRPQDRNSESPPPYEEAILDKECTEEAIGQRVCISGVKRGILRYYGRTKFAEGLWCGVELDEPVGKNNGTVNGIQYFIAKPNHGIFAPVGKVSKVESGWASEMESIRPAHSVERNASHKVPEFSLPEQMLLKQSSSDPSFIRQNAEFMSDGVGFGTFLGDKRSLTEQRELSILAKKVRSSTVFYTFSENSGKYKALPQCPANLEHTSSDSSSDDAVAAFSRTQETAIHNFSSANLKCDGISTQSVRKASYDTALQSVSKTGGIKQSSSFPRSVNFPSVDLNPERLHHFGERKNVSHNVEDTAISRNKPSDYQNEIFPLNFFLASEHRDDNDDDDQMSLDVDESLGILTPNQMKDFTISADPLNSCTELKTFTFPSSESFDDINDIPEDEQLHDITVEYVGSSSSSAGTQKPLAVRSDVVKDLEQNEQLTSTDKFLYNYSKKISSEIDSQFHVDKVHRFNETLEKKREVEVSNADVTEAKCIMGGHSLDSIGNYETPSVAKLDLKLEPKSPKMMFDNREIAFVCEQNSAVFTSFEAEANKTKFDGVSRTSQSLRHLTEDLNIRKYYDTDSSRDSLLQGDHDHVISKEKQLTVSWEDCIERDTDEMFTRVERPESVYTVGSNDTGYQEDGEFDAEIGMTTSTESNEIGKRFSTISRDSCLASEDLDKVTESTSTSGYSTGLSDSYCNDRVDDEMTKPTIDDSSTEAEVRRLPEDDFHCQRLPRSSQVEPNGDHSDKEFTENENAGYSETASISHDFTNEDIVSCLENTVNAWPETSTEDTTIADQINGDLEETLTAEKTLPDDSEDLRAGEITESDNLHLKSVKEPSRTLTDKPSVDDSHNKFVAGDMSCINSQKFQSAQVSGQEGRTLEKSAEVAAVKSKREDERKKQITKSPRKNVMSKIKAMIEATSCKTMSRNKTDSVEHSEKKAGPHKKSRWEAVTSKIAASLAEEKTKPKAKREIKSKVNTNLSLVRQQRACKSPRLDSARVSDAEAGSVSSVSSKGFRDNKCSNVVAQKHEMQLPVDKSRGRSPRSGGKPCMSSRSTSPVAASESSTTVSLTSHHSKARIAIWKGSSSTIASSIPPPQVKTKPPTHPPPVKVNITNSRNAQKVPPKRSTEHGSVRVLHHPSPKPVRPPMWLSRAELSQEIQHLGTLCEARTKELNLLKMKLKHATLGFDAFVAVFKYLTEDLDALSHPQLVKELAKTQKLLHQAKNDIVCYEKQIEELKTHHAKELAELSGKMLAVYQSELQQVTSKQGEELQLIEEQHQKKMVNLQASFMEASEKAKTHHEKEAEAIRQKFLKQKEEAELLHQSEMKHLEESHLEVQKSLQAEIEQLKLQYAESKQQSRNIEETLQKDTDTKLQWISCKKADLEKEVDSLKAVLEMKNNEIHSLRKENLEMQKELEELPIAKEKIKMLQARAEDLQALMAEKVRVERQLSTEHQTMKEVFERESKMNKRLSMENEELQWRLKQTSELSLLLRSQTNSPDVLETPSPPKSPWQQQQSSRSKFFTYMDASECDPESPQAKSPVPVTSSRSKFFTFVDPSEYDAQSPHSPRYKRIAPSLSSSPCKQPPVKNPVKLPLASTPRKNKGISEAPPGGATPRKMSKKQNGKDSQVYANVKSSDEEAADAANIPTSMDSSISSEDSALQPRDLEDPIAPICNPTKELLSDENAECTRLEYGKSVKQDSDVCVLGEVTDPKKYYHMTFPVLKETGPDCDVDEGNNYLLIENNETCFLTAKETSDPSENVLLNGYVNPNGETHFEPENTQNETKRLTCDKMDCDSIEQTSGNSNAMDTSSYPVAVSISHTARNEDSKGNNVETSSELAST